MGAHDEAGTATAARSALAALFACALVAAAALSGCGDEGGVAGGCGLGSEQDCTCEDGSAGTQACILGGVYGVCVCDADADIGGGDLPGSDMAEDTATDSGEPDADAEDTSGDAPVDASADRDAEELDQADGDDAGDGGGADLADAGDLLDVGDALGDPTDAEHSDLDAGTGGDPDASGDPDVVATGDPDVTSSGDPDVTSGGDPDVISSGDPDLVSSSDPDVISSDDPDLFVSSDPDLVFDDPDLPGPDIFGRDLGPNGEPVIGEEQLALWFDSLFVEGGGTAIISVMMNNPMSVYGAQFTVTGATLVGHPFDGRAANAGWTMRGNSGTGTVIAYSSTLEPITPDNSLLFLLRIEWPPDYARIDFTDGEGDTAFSDVEGAPIDVVTNGYTFPWP